MSNKKRILVKTNSDQVVQYDGIHDSEIKGLNLAEEDRTLEISLKAESGERFKIYLSGIRNLSCNGFRTQNVVFRILVSKEIDTRTELKSEQKLFGFNDKDLELTAKEIQDGKLLLFQVDASVGCDISCICEKVEIE